MTAENWSSSLLGNGVKQVPAEIYTHVTIEEIPFLCNGSVKTQSGYCWKLCFIFGPYKVVIKKNSVENSQSSS
jgi:hypothetical protein